MKSWQILFIFFVSFVFGQTDITKYLPQNYVRNGSVDYTEYLQKAFDEDENILMPDFPILINYKGLNVKSNQIITFQRNSELIMKPNAETHYAMLQLKNVDNVKIINPKLKGDINTHQSSEGEWGMGINIISSSNILVKNPNISNTWGDGIYIGEIKMAERKSITRKSYASSRVQIFGGVIDNCLRNGISITSGYDIQIDGTTIQNINSKPPRAAIDIEPNHDQNIIKDIKIENIITRQNFNGIVIMLIKIISEKSANIGTVEICNHTDYDSRTSLSITNYSKKMKNSNLKALEGQIIIKDNNYYGTAKVYVHNKNRSYNPKIRFENLKYYTKNSQNKYILNKDFSEELSSSLKNDKRVTYK